MLDSLLQEGSHHAQLFEHVLDELEEIKLVFQAWLSYAALRKIKNENRKMKNEKRIMKNEKLKTKHEKRITKIKNENENEK